MTVELLNIKLRALAHSAPQDRPALLMNFQHVTFCFFSRITEHALKNHRDVGHQVYWIVMDNHLPRDVEFVFFPGVRFVGGRFDR